MPNRTRVVGHHLVFKNQIKNLKRLPDDNLIPRCGEVGGGDRGGDGKLVLRW